MKTPLERLSHRQRELTPLPFAFYTQEGGLAMEAYCTRCSCWFDGNLPGCPACDRAMIENAPGPDSMVECSSCDGTLHMMNAHAQTGTIVPPGGDRPVPWLSVLCPACYYAAQE